MIERFEDYTNNNNNINEKSSKEETSTNLPFSSFRNTNLTEDDRIDISQKHHLEWVKAYPFLKQLNLETDYIHSTKEHIWFYGLNRKQTGLDFNIFLEVRKKTNWSIILEISTNLEDDFETDSKTQLEDSQSYEKSGLTYEQLLSNIREVSKFLKKWNSNIQEETDHNPLSFE